ncbi:MAG: hypothetical protein K0S33_1602 [Bacteroidetes bacterium]|jgi:hypothetical protein|nr:hypothetical protein [Bacteroidota bacterium]
MKAVLYIAVLTLSLTAFSALAQLKIKVPNIGGNDNKSNKSSNSSNSSSGASGSYTVNDKVSIEENGKWYPGYIMEVKGDQYKIHYDGYDPKYDTWVGTSRLKAVGGNTSAASANNTAKTPTAAAGTYNKGDIVDFLYRDTWVEGEVVSEISAAGRYQVKYGTLYEYVYPKDIKPTDKPNANIGREKIAEQKKKDDEAKAKQEAEDAIGTVEGDLYKQWYKDVEFAGDAVGQLCYYLDKAPSTAPGFNATLLPATMKTLEQLEKVMKEKYPNAKSAKHVNRFSTHYTQQPGLYREVYEERKELAKRALAYDIGRKLKGVWTYEGEAKALKTYDAIRGTLLCRTYLEYAYLPGTFSKMKENIKKEYEPAYKAAGIEFKDEEVFAEQIKQNAETKKITEEMIGQYSLANYKTIAKYHDKEAEAEALSAFKTDCPGATPVYVGCTTEYVISYDNNWSPPKNLGKGLGLVVLAKVTGVPYLVAYSCTIDKDYKGGGNYGPAYLTANGFYFWGLVNTQ